MDNQNRCPGCFSVIDNQVPCSCGYNVNSSISSLALPPLSLLNKQYLVGRVLGKPGGFGITYLGWDTRLETLVAIKEYMPRDLAGRSSDHSTVYPHSREDNESFQIGLEQFLEEARTLARFDHPNIVRVRSFFVENETAYLVMDYLKGKNLAEQVALSGGKLSEAEALRIILPVLDGLREMHSKGVLHRDIKPQNIYLTESSRPILLDFGAARQAISDRSRSISVIFTPGFAPYEQYHRKGDQGPWTDIYACAATLYFMISGKVPDDALERVGKDNLISPREIGGTGSQHINCAIMQGLSMNPNDRPQDVFLFLKMLVGEEKEGGISSLLGHAAATVKEINVPEASSWKEKQLTEELKRGVPDANAKIQPQLIGGIGLQLPKESERKNPGFLAGNRKKFAVVAMVLLFFASGIVYSQYNSTDTLAFSDGRKYSGDIRWGKATGNGSMTYPDGRVFIGTFKDGTPNGPGTMVLVGGYRYEGTSNNGRRHGIGKLLDSKQEKVYDGQWENDLRSGIGVAVLPDGLIYTGDFSNDKREGKGKLVDKRGQSLYEGTWQSDEKNGSGKLWYADRSYYDGQIKEGKRNGRGKQYNADGSLTYEGDWANDLRHGQGTYIAADGHSTTGAWNNGSYVEPRVTQAPAVEQQVTQAPAPIQRKNNSNNPSAPVKRRDSSQAPQKKGDPTPEEVFGAFFNIINKLEKK